MSRPWTRADYLRDISDQTEDMNAAWRDEYASDRDGAEVYGWDEPPTRQEIEADNRDLPSATALDPWGEA